MDITVANGGRTAFAYVSFYNDGVILSVNW